MAADVYDFKTGKLCKCCEGCQYWKEIADFPKMEGERYGVGPVCTDCIIDETDYTFTPMEDEPNDEIA